MATGGSMTVKVFADRDGERLVDSMARALNAAGIPCVLWGQFLWSAHGVPTTYSSNPAMDVGLIPAQSLDLVIPDAMLAAATEVISTSKDLTWTLGACPDTTTCPNSQPNRHWPVSDVHLHIEQTDPRVTAAVCLFPQSKTLWFLPELGASLANPRANPLPRYLALASDPTALPPFEIGMGRGLFRSDQTVVLVPRAHILTEALMRIMARDHGKSAGMHAGAIVGYMSLYVERRGLLNISLLPEPFGVLYAAHTKDESVTGRELMVRLMRTLGMPVKPSEYR